MKRRRVFTATVGPVVLGGLLMAGYGPALAAPKEDPHAGLPPNWDQTLPANNPGGPCPSSSSRFTCVMGGAAVRDNETGLVWETTPANTPLPIPPALSNWFDARLHCTRRVNTGNRKGWRLPSVHELSSLMDPSVPPPGAMLPAPGNNPFSIWAPFVFWSATSATDNPGFSGNPTGAAWFVDFGTGEIDFTYKYISTKAQAWCVRGGGGDGVLY